MKVPTRTHSPHRIAVRNAPISCLSGATCPSHLESRAWLSQCQAEIRPWSSRLATGSFSERPAAQTMCAASSRTGMLLRCDARRSRSKASTSPHRDCIMMMPLACSITGMVSTRATRRRNSERRSKSPRVPDCGHRDWMSATSRRVARLAARTSSARCFSFPARSRAACACAISFSRRGSS